MSALHFVERDRCISCGSDQWSSLWQNNFASVSSASYMDKFSYAVPWREHIGDETFNLVRCNDCDTVFHQRILDDASLGQLYSSWIDEAQTEAFAKMVGAGLDRTFTNTEQMVKHVLRIRSLWPDSEELRVLDYGCGDGQFLRIAESFGLDAFGVDMSDTRHEQALENGVRISSNLDQVDEAGVGALHAVTLFQVLEHLANPREVLSSLHKRMAPEAILVVEVPDCRDVVSEPKDFEAFHNVNPLEHINAFTPESLTNICVKSGFSEMRRPPAYVTTKIHKLPKTALSTVVTRPTTQRYFRRSSD